MKASIFNFLLASAILFPRGDLLGEEASCTTIDLSTGTQDFSTVPFGSFDNDWYTVSTPTSGLGPAYSIAPHPSGWVTTPVANWIDPFNTDGTSTLGFDPAGPYQLQMQFVLDFDKMKDFQLEIDVAADNGATFELNGATIGSAPGFSSFAHISVTDQSKFFNGVNFLNAYVDNLDRWMGLLVSGGVTYQNLIADVSTGTTNGNADPLGTIDPDWQVAVLPNQTGPAPAFSIDANPGWVQPVGANWIDPYSNSSLLSDPPGSYEYALFFACDYANNHDFRLQMEFAADNEAQVFLNGSMIGSTSTFQNMTQLVVTNQLLFLDGVNLLRIKATNGSTGGSNPTGILVTGCVTADCGPTALADCNGNGVHDSIDVATGVLHDDNKNGTPDECESCQQDLGYGGPGDAVLSICGGDMSTGTFSDLLLTCAPPNQLAFVIAGPTFQPTAFMGGTLVPLPPSLVQAVAINGNGEFLAANIPGGNGPFTVYIQMVYLDANQSQGVGLSNAIQLDLLP